MTSVTLKTGMKRERRKRKAIGVVKTKKTSRKNIRRNKE